MSSFGGWGVPGTGTLAESTEREIVWGGDRAKGLVLMQNAVYSGAARDAGHTSYTTVLRAGLLMGKVTSTGELEEWDADAADGTQDLWGVVPHEIRTNDFDANNTDRVAGVIVRAPLKASQLLIQGTAFTSHADEFLARRQLHAMGCILDDDPQGYKAGVTRRELIQSGNLTVTEAMNGTTFVASGADSAFTLPTIHPGLHYEFAMVSDHELSVVSVEGDNIVGGNDAAGDSIVYTTAGEQIGARLVFESHYSAAGTLKWFYAIQKVAFSTDDFLAYTFNT